MPRVALSNTASSAASSLSSSPSSSASSSPRSSPPASRPSSKPNAIEASSNGAPLHRAGRSGSARRLASPAVTNGRATPLPRASDTTNVPEETRHSRASRASGASAVVESSPISDQNQRSQHPRFPSLNRDRSIRGFEAPSHSYSLHRPQSSTSVDNPPSPLTKASTTTSSPNPSLSTAATPLDPDVTAFGSSSLTSSRSNSSAVPQHRNSPSTAFPANFANASSDRLIAPFTRPQGPERSPSTGVTTEALSAGDWAFQQAQANNKSVNMHQTSSRLLRMTDDDRPFTRDFKDLFSTLIVSLPLTPHRVRFSKVEHTFTTEEALTNLGSLKFSQSNRMPDPKDPSRIVTTTTTTTFSMAKEMARSVCNRFLDARLVESCEGKNDFASKNAVWQLTPKGMRVLTRFCSRNGIHQRHVNDILDSPRNVMQLVILERDLKSDKINHDRAIIEVIFRRFAGDQPNVKATSGSSDTDSLTEYATSLVGVRTFKSRKPADKDCPYVFNGKSAMDWLMECCMVVDARECLEIANFFIGHDLINRIPDEKDLENRKFQPIKTAHYHFTQRGMKLVGWMRSPSASVNGDNMLKAARDAGKDSNNNKMAVIMRDPALRLLFREFLIDTHCEENLTFYIEVKSFLNEYSVAKREDPGRLDLIRENLASAYSLYNAFLAPGSPCELNIDHNLRNALAGRMTRAVGQDSEMVSSLDEVAVLFDQAQTSVFKLMASDSVPKFARDPKYATVLRDRNLDYLLTGLPSN